MHCSFAADVPESARLYFGNEDTLQVLQIDPRRVRKTLRIEATPRGPMPHIYGEVPVDAVRGVFSVGDGLEDVIAEHRVAMIAFSGMTLLDFVLPYDALRRVPQVRIETLLADAAYASHGIEVHGPIRPSLSDYDVLVVPGGLGTRTLQADLAVVDWLRSFPCTRMVASVCTGALLLGAAGRLAARIATTHRSELDALAAFGASVDRTARVVDDGDVITAGGVTCGLELGLALVDILSGQGASVADAMHVGNGRV